MDAWWVRSETSYGVGSRWHGPYPDVETAQRAAAQFSGQGESVAFAEVIHGPRGGKGRRVREFHRGQDYLPGESSWYPSRPPWQIDIPAGE
jgi:hypothetical protein